MPFKNRVEAGQKLAEALQKYQGKELVVYGMPRGGVETAFEIARRLGAPLDLIIARKIGHPYSPEYAVAAIGEDGYLLVNPEEEGNLDPRWLKEEAAKEHREAQRRREVYLGGREPMRVEGKIAILVDDGVATGLTMKVAIEELKKRNPGKIVVAVPVAPRETVRELRKMVDEVAAIEIPRGFFGAIGAYYEDFRQLEDEDVVRLLKESARLE